jgi:hypothetical protein
MLLQLGQDQIIPLLKDGLREAGHCFTVYACHIWELLWTYDPDVTAAVPGTQRRLYRVP